MCLQTWPTSGKRLYCGLLSVLYTILFYCLKVYFYMCIYTSIMEAWQASRYIKLWSTYNYDNIARRLGIKRLKTTFSGFSVGSCINEEKGYLLPTWDWKITYWHSTECSSRHQGKHFHPDDNCIQSKRWQVIFKAQVATDNLPLHPMTSASNLLPYNLRGRGGCPHF